MVSVRDDCKASGLWGDEDEEVFFERCAFPAPLPAYPKFQNATGLHNPVFPHLSYIMFASVAFPVHLNLQQNNHQS